MNKIAINQITSLVSVLPPAQLDHPLSPTHHDRFSTSAGSDTIPTPVQNRGKVATITASASAKLSLSSPTPSDAATSTKKKKKKKKQKKKVQFSRSRQQIFPIISLEDYTDQEIEDSWLNWKDKGRSYKSFQRTVQRMASGLEPRKNDTFRGLESFSKDNSSDQTIHDCVDAVMDEQERQWEEPGVYDFDRCREMSLECSTLSSDLALQRAEFDACEARHAYIAMSTSSGDNDSLLLSDGDDNSSLESEASDDNVPAEIPQSIKDAADCTRCWHPRKLKTMLCHAQ